MVGLLIVKSFLWYFHFIYIKLESFRILGESGEALKKKQLPFLESFEWNTELGGGTVVHSQLDHKDRRLTYVDI